LPAPPYRVGWLGRGRLHCDGEKAIDLAIQIAFRPTPELRANAKQAETALMLANDWYPRDARGRYCLGVDWGEANMPRCAVAVIARQKGECSGRNSRYGTMSRFKSLGVGGCA
jgi:hypothetical protein